MLGVLVEVEMLTLTRMLGLVDIDKVVCLTLMDIEMWRTNQEIGEFRLL